MAKSSRERGKEPNGEEKIDGENEGRDKEGKERKR